MAVGLFKNSRNLNDCTRKYILCAEKFYPQKYILLQFTCALKHLNERTDIIWPPAKHFPCAENNSLVCAETYVLRGNIGKRTVIVSGVRPR